MMPRRPPRMPRRSWTTSSKHSRRAGARGWVPVLLDGGHERPRRKRRGEGREDPDALERGAGQEALAPFVAIRNIRAMRAAALECTRGKTGHLPRRRTGPVMPAVLDRNSP